MSFARSTVYARFEREGRSKRGRKRVREGKREGGLVDGWTGYSVRYMYIHTHGVFCYCKFT